MGRIAEALKRAESERRESTRMGTPTPAPRGGLEHLRVNRAPSSPIAAAPIPAAPPTPTTAWDPRLVVQFDRAGAVAEQYRAIRTWLLAHNSTGEHRILGLTSSTPGEGKTVTVGNLGLALAEVRHLSVLMVDGDLRRPALGRTFGFQPDTRDTTSAGLADVLAGRGQLADVIRPSAVENLHILPAGSAGTLTPAELLNARAARRVFDEIRDRFHYVLVDTPAVQSASDVAVLGAMCTGMLMVVRMNQPSSGIVRQSVRWLQANNVHVLGCIAVGANNRASHVLYQNDAS